MNLLRSACKFSCLGILGATLAGGSWAADLGDRAAPLQIQSWIKGKPVDMKAGEGKNIYVIEFWATWCPPCKLSIPHLTQLQRQFKDDRVIIIGISNEPAETVTPYVEKMADQMNYLVAVDPLAKTHEGFMKAFGVGGMPYAFVVDRTGAVVWHGHPMMGLREAIQELLAGKLDLDKTRRAVLLHPLFQQYLLLASTGVDSDRAAQIGEQMVTSAALNPILVNEFAWMILDGKDLKNRDVKLALRAVRAASKATQDTNVMILDTYARALFENGEPRDAIVQLKKALALTQDPAVRGPLEQNLKKYETRVTSDK